MAGAGGSSEEFLGGSTVHQIVVWGVLVELLNSILSPVLREIEQTVNSVQPTAQISPETLADLVVKGYMPIEQGASVARKSGISPADFLLMVEGTGQPIGLQDALFAWRRGYIPFDAPEPGAPSVETAIRTSHIDNLWKGTIQKLGLVPIGVADAVDAVVEGQIPYTQGETIAYQNGVSNEDFQILFNTRGNPPGPADLIELVRRGFIPLQGTGPTVTSLQQGIYEGATKDKWEPLYEKLTDYLPPPRTVTALQRAGAIDATEALGLYKQQGLSDTLASAYVQNASNDKLAGSKQLAESIVTKLYYDQAIDNPTAVSMLEPLGYDATEAGFILEVQDLQRITTATNSAISRIGTLFIGHKIDTPTARQALGALQVPASQIEQLIQTWLIESASNLKTLTQAEITDAFMAELMDQTQAMNELEGIGYTPYDAWVLLSLKNKAALPNQPAENLVNPVHPLPAAGG